jgi:acyl-CoA thioester hydrolase
MSEVFRFFHPMRVRWAECDMQGIVFNPHYLMYFDVAFTEYLRALGLPYPQAFAAEGTDTFMVSARIDFRASARYDDELAIGVRTSYLGTTSFRLAFSIRRQADVLVEGVAAYVNGDRETHAPRALPERLVSVVTAFEAKAPERK